MTAPTTFWTCPTCQTGFDAIADLSAHQSAETHYPVLMGGEAALAAASMSDKILAIFADDYADRDDLGDNARTLLTAVRAEMQARAEIHARGPVCTPGHHVWRDCDPGNCAVAHAEEVTGFVVDDE